MLCARRDHRVSYPNGEARSLNLVNQPAPNDRYFPRPIQAVYPTLQSRKPFLQICLPPSRIQPVNPAPNLSHDHRICDAFHDVFSKPIHRLLIALLLCRLTQQICINKELHSKTPALSSSLVSPRSGCTNQSFSGHAKSQSTKSGAEPVGSSVNATRMRFPFGKRRNNPAITPALSSPISIVALIVLMVGNCPRSCRSSIDCSGNDRYQTISLAPPFANPVSLSGKLRTTQFP
jgi:hypothetical protein